MSGAPVVPVVPGVTGELGPETTERRRVSGARALKRTAGIVVFLLVFNHIVLPQLGGARSAANTLSRVSPLLLVVALGLEIGALFAYAQLTRVALPDQPRLRLGTVFRIQLATRAVTNLVPGGSAAGGTLAYRLLTQAGVPSPAAGFALASVSLGSAVVLNVLLWIALLISIPIDGINPVYGSAAIIGMVLLAAFGGLVLLLMRGRDGAERVVRAIAGRIPLVDPDTAARFVRQLAVRLHDIAAEPALIRRGLLWSVANWLLDASALWVFVRAFGPALNPVDVIVAFCLANILAAIPITPGGLGVVEAVLTSTLVGFGLDRGTAAISVVSYRVAQYWLPIPLGAAAYATLRVGPRSIERIRRHRIRTLAEDTADVAGLRVWDVDTPVR